MAKKNPTEKQHMGAVPSASPTGGIVGQVPKAPMEKTSAPKAEPKAPKKK